MRPVRRPEKLTTFMFQLSGNLRVSTSWSPKRPFLACTEIAFTSALYTTTQWCNVAESNKNPSTKILSTLSLSLKQVMMRAFFQIFLVFTPAVISRIVTRCDFIFVSRSVFVFIFSVFSRQVNLFAGLFLSGQIVVFRL